MARIGKSSHHPTPLGRAIEECKGAKYTRKEEGQEKGIIL